ncbi:MAG TPA: TspO/MBR family protein [Candidatus Limnocylindrales bacterium]|nr:TspO/MBR family protein [Candidatus Limnocylindrales bacterium]
MSNTVRQIITLVLAIGTIAFNGISQAIPLNNQTSADIANRFTPNYFLPANYVFSIWGIIYIGLIAYGIYQMLPAQRENTTLKAIAPWFWVTCIANMTWLVLFHYEQFALSTVAMVALLISLIVIYLRLRRDMLSRGEYWFVSVPMSIYFGWITVATVANVTYVLLSGNWDGLGVSAETWGAIMIIVAGLIASVVAFRYRDLAYGAVIAWAYVGLFSRHEGITTVIVPALAMAAVVVVAVAAGYFLGRRSAVPAPMARA